MSSSSGPFATRSSSPLSDSEPEAGDQKPRYPGVPRSSLFSRPVVEVVVRSADRTEFYVPRQFLVDASPVLEDMCNAAAPAMSVDLPETSDAVEALLLLCHPLAPEPRFPSLGALKPAVPLCLSYKLRGNAGDRVTRALVPLLEKEPVQVYVFAVEDDIAGLMATAARESLRLAGALDDHDALDTISGRAYRRLLVYRKACAAKMEDIGTYHAKDDKKWVWRSCWCADESVGAAWFDAFYRSLAQVLQATPHPDVMEGALRAAAKCACGILSPCTARAWKDLPSFLDEFANEVDRRISEVTF